MTTTTRSTSLLVSALALLISCGEDEPAPAAEPKADKNDPEAAAAPPPRPGGAPPAAGAKPGDKAAPALRPYPKILEDDRREFRERDFQPDPTAAENRDPFRSYVVRQPGLATPESASTIVDNSDVCQPKNTRAENYSVRDLRLIGIVLRGTQSYALFRDPSQNGHIVRRGNCVGREKAVVEAITNGFVRLEVIPEAPPGGKTPEPEKREIPLHPEELELTTDGDDSGSGASVEPIPSPRPAPSKTANPPAEAAPAPAAPTPAPAPAPKPTP